MPLKRNGNRVEWWIYALALLSVSVILMLTSINQGPFAELNERVLLIAAVMLASWLGGWKPGLLATLASVLVYFYLPPRPSILDLGQSLRFIEFIFVAFLITFLNEKRRTSQQQAEVARQAAEAANRTKDEFLAAVSHDLRTPLTSILGWAEVLSMNGQEDRALTIRGLEAITRSARKQSLLIEDLLDMSRVSTGHLRIELEPLKLSKVIDEAIDTLLPAIQAKGLRLQKEFDKSEVAALGDERRLQQVIWNLISNAIKFSIEGGLITVRLETRKAHAYIVVADNGKGIASDFLPHVFEPFCQEKEAGSNRREGLGLGLAICRHLVELHGGSMRARSRGLGKGAAFIVQLPLINDSSEESSRVHDVTINTASILKAAAVP